MSWDEGFAVGLAVGRKRFGGALPREDDEWTYPADWLQMPAAISPNTGYFLFSCRSTEDSFDITMPFYQRSGKSGFIKFEWGDGTSDTFDSSHLSEDSSGGTPCVRHTYTVSDGHSLINGTTQFMLKITCQPNDEEIEYGGRYWVITNTNSYSSVEYRRLKAAAFDVNIDFGNVNHVSKLSNHEYVNYIKLCGDVGNYMKKARFVIGNKPYLRRIDVDSRTDITEMYEYNFVRCGMITKASYIPFTAHLKKMGDNCFSSSVVSMKLSFPEIEEIGDYCFYSTEQLSEFHAPRLETVGSNCFRYCSSLNVFEASETFDVEEARQRGSFAYSPIV